jgi:hypothetical protein
MELGTSPMWINIGIPLIRECRMVQKDLATIPVVAYRGRYLRTIRIPMKSGTSYD